jgi:hypothetical protein
LSQAAVALLELTLLSIARVEEVLEAIAHQ